MTTTVATLPAQTADGFSPEELDQWDRQGFVISRGLGDSSLMQDMRREVLQGLEQLSGLIEFEADVHYPGAPASREAEGGRTVRRLKQAHSRGFVFTEWLQHPSVVGRLRQLLGPTIACPLAHHNCIMTKSPRFSSRTAWHQDIRYWSFVKPELASVWLALGHETPENGCLQLLPGTHRQTFSPDRLDPELFLREDVPENAELIATAIDAPLEPGDVLFFHCRTFHAAGVNATSQTKHSVVFTYRGGDNAVIPGSRSASLPEMLISANDGPS
ncbi:MAG: phytanoyl-CoA dioxygenase family protein [Planctomycetaceae bacterium]|nr:phytanoyl-CoA dioxygenase family protein [Planctomycetaceae bacterium]